MSARNLPRVPDKRSERQEIAAELQRRVLATMRTKRLSKRAVAKKAGLAYTVIHELTVYGTDPKLSTLHRLAMGLGVTLAELIL